jgi:hypothetical protein
LHALQGELDLISPVVRRLCTPERIFALPLEALTSRRRFQPSEIGIVESYARPRRGVYHGGPEKN